MMRRPWVDSSSYLRRGLRGRALMRIRAEVFASEAGCYRCGSVGADSDVLDHVVPLRDGGSDSRSNLRRCCLGCHKSKSSSEGHL